MAPETQMKRRIGMTGAVSLTVGNVIGVGIFTTVGIMLAQIPHPLWVICLWLAGGVLTLAGAWCYGALGATYPQAGGDYVFLRKGLGEWASFALGWLLVLVIFPASIAALATALLECAQAFAPIRELHPGALEFQEYSRWYGVALVLGIHALCVLNVSWVMALQKVTVGFLLLFILAFVFFGFGWGEGSWSHFSAEAFTPGASALGAAGVAIVFSYSGYFQVAYLGGEVQSPHKTIPRSILASVLLVTALYAALVVLYLYAAPIGALAGRTDAGRVAAIHLWGPERGGYVSWGILLAILGSLNATVAAGPRITFAMARDRCFPGLFGLLWKRSGAPACALGLQAVVSMVYLWGGVFEELLSYASMAMVLACIGAGISLLRLRRHVQKTGFARRGVITAVCAVFLSTYTALGITISRAYPVQSLTGIGLILLSAPLYILWKRVSGNPQPTTSR